MLNRLSTEFGIKEKNLTIGKQGVEIRSKKQQLVFVIHCCPIKVQNNFLTS